MEGFAMHVQAKFVIDDTSCCGHEPGSIQQLLGILSRTLLLSTIKTWLTHIGTEIQVNAPLLLRLMRQKIQKYKRNRSIDPPQNK
jgi:hypothetical protein